MDYTINVTTPGTYTVWLRGYPPNAAGDSAYVGLGQQVVTVTGFTPYTWTWASEAARLTITNTGRVTAGLWMREDGLWIDRLLLTTDTTYIPTGFGPVETERQTGTGGLVIPLTRTIVYTYDNLYRLTDAGYSSGETYQYSYDPVGNRLQQIINGDTTDYLYDAANRLAGVDGQAHSFDANGNLLTTGVMTNTWDAANRLIGTERNETALQPIYNGVNDRVGQTVGTTTTNFALDVQGLPEVIYTGEGNVYLHLPGVIMTESSAGEVRYLLSDGLGSVRHAVDENAEIVVYHEFDPYGNPVQNGGDPYGYTGEWWEDEVGLLHLRARWYSPETGTFLSVDPVESEPPYQYVRGNVVNWMDPSGRFSPDAIRTSVPPDVWSILKSSRKGLYKLLLEAKDGDIVEPLWITITPFDNGYTPVHPIPHESAILECIGGRNIEVKTFNRGQYLPHKTQSLGRYLKDIEWEEETQIASVYQKGSYHNIRNNLLTSKWAKQSFTHYYSLSRLTNRAQYYSDFIGQDSPLPDIVAKNISLDLQVVEVGYTKLVDRFGRGYTSWVGNVGPGLPINYNYSDGYVYPRSIANSPEALQRTILQWGEGVEADLANWGGGVSHPIPNQGTGINWFSRGFTAGLGYNVGYVERASELDVQGWDFLDQAASPGIVAVTPDNGCNCGG